MDFLRKFEGNRHGGRKFPQKRRKMDKLAFKSIENRLMENLGSIKLKLFSKKLAQKEGKKEMLIFKWIENRLMKNPS